MNDFQTREKWDLTRDPKTLLNFDEIYTFIKIIGNGGFGNIWLIEDKETNKKYALKLFEKNAKFMFDRELSVFSQVPNDPDISHFFNSFRLEFSNQINEDYPIYAILMEYIYGHTLNLYKGKFTIDEICIIAKWLYRKISDLETARIIHNDIRTVNVMLDEDNNLKLIP